MLQHVWIEDENGNEKFKFEKKISNVKRHLLDLKWINLNVEFWMLKMILEFDIWIWKDIFYWHLTPKGLRQPKLLFVFLGRPLWMHSIFRIFETFCGGRYGW